MLNSVEIFHFMASQNKIPDSSFLFGWQYQPLYRFINESTSTVPDMVLSMKDIYERYAVSGDISSLPGSVRPYIDDPEDSGYRESPEEPLDLLYASRSARMLAEDLVLEEENSSADLGSDPDDDDKQSAEKEEVKETFSEES